MDNKDSKKSVNEILEDLNNLLNRMPQILSGIKLPDIKPVEFDKIVVKNFEKEDNLAGKQEIREESGLILGEESTLNGVASDKPDWQNENPVQEEENSNKNSRQEDKPFLDLQTETSQNVEEKSGTFEIIEKKESEGIKEKKEENKILESTVEFSVPDVDFLMNIAISHKENGGEMKEEQKETENELNSEFNLENEKDDITKVEQTEEEKTLVFNMDNIPISQNNDNNSVKEKRELPENQVNLQEEEKKFAELIQSDSELTNQPAIEIVSEQHIEEPTLENIQQEVISESKQNLDENVPKREETEIQTFSETLNEEKVKNIENVPLEEIDVSSISLGIQENQKAQMPVSGDIESEKTLFVQPSENSEEKTILFQEPVSVSPAETSRKVATDEDLDSVLNKMPPENVLPERVKNVGFMYSADKTILLHLLNILDEVCLMSEEKPMFVNRSFVLEFSQDINPNYLIQKVNETNTIAFIAVGEFPQEKIYEMNTVFNSGNIIFRHINADNLNRSNIINFILELIIK